MTSIYAYFFEPVEKTAKQFLTKMLLTIQVQKRRTFPTSIIVRPLNFFGV